MSACKDDTKVKSDLHREMEDPEFRRLFIQERTIVEVTGMIAREMKRQNITQAELARRMRKTKGHISQLLGGGRNLTLHSLSDMLLAIGMSLEPMLRPAASPRGRVVCIGDARPQVKYTAAGRASGGLCGGSIEQATDGQCAANSQSRRRKPAQSA